jgi:folate-binding protein YgfZ
VLRAKVQIEIDTRALMPRDALQSVEAHAGPAFDWAPDRVLLATGDRTFVATADSSDAGRVAAESGAAIWERWQLSDIARGLPQVSAAASGQFVAQMLNLDLLDAISFTKGCYTGQEIIARTHNLGRIKRRLLRYAVADGSPPPPMTALHRDGTKVAEVLMSARSGAGSELLAVTSLDARDRPLALDDGRVAAPLPLPYPV